MKLLKTLAKAVTPGFVQRKLAALSEVEDSIQPVRSGPVAWDEAAVQLGEYLPRGKGGYPQFLYGLLSAARTARAIGAKEFTAIEFGVAGGNGLVHLERYAALVEQRWGLAIKVVGFDMSSGLPVRTDPRDCPFAFRGGEFKMDEAKLRSRLKKAELLLGDVATTVKRFAAANYPPIGFISNDLDLYTSTRDSFALLDLAPQRLLPRVAMYFDDLLGYPYTTITGEWAAINESNSLRKQRQIALVYGLRHYLGRTFRFAHWPDQFFLLHVFDHPGYNSPEVTSNDSLALRS